MASENYHIAYLKNKEIDRIKWDKCIHDSPSGIIYSQSFYLDCMCNNWDALVMNDYEIVMPLIWKKKYGFHYLYQQYFVRCIGIFGSISQKIVNTFLKAIPAHFKYCDIDFKENIISPDQFILPNAVLKKRTNFFLDLNKNYSDIESSYKRLAHRMLRKANENNIEILRNCDPAEVINFYKKNYTIHHSGIASKDYEKLSIAAGVAFKKGNASTYLAKTGETIIAVYMILKDEKFIYSLIGGANKIGKNLGAFYLLTDAAIHDHSSSERVFRFEGSDKKGIAFFNSQFNPTPFYYYNLKNNLLPWPLKLFK